MAIVSRLQIDHPPLDDPGGAPLHTQVENNWIKIGDNLSARYFEGIAVANGATVIFDHNFKMPFDELAFKVYLLAGAGGELTVTTETDYAIIATPGNLTTQISVTNNSGGVSTFAVLIQSLGGGGGGGGQSFYDFIIDAGGDGDYTSIKTAVETEDVNKTFYIKNGTYLEATLIQVKQGQKIHGESRDGVTVEGQSTVVFDLPSLITFVRGNTHRNSDNSDWDSGASIGLVTLTNGSAIGTYSGSTDPQANDGCIIGPAGDQFDIISVDGGLNQVTLDRPWKGGAATLDWIVLATPSESNWKERPTEIKNLTTINSAVSSNAFLMSDSVNCLIEDILCLNSSPSTSTGTFFLLDGAYSNTVRNIESRSLAIDVPFINGSSRQQGHNKWENITTIGHANNSWQGSSTKPQVYNQYHFASVSEIDDGSYFINNVTAMHMVHCNLRVDRLSTCSLGFFAAQSVSNSIQWYGAEFVFGLIDSEVGVMRFNCAKSRVSIKQGYHTETLVNVVENVRELDPEYFNMLHDSYLSGTIRNSVFGDTIISSSVIYGGFADANQPALNSGFDYTSPPVPPGPVVTGQVLYDAIVDAAGGGDYVSILTACSSEAVGATIYIRNGSYAESLPIDPQLGQKLIGESRDGVVITSTSTLQAFMMPPIASSSVGASVRTFDNLAWNPANSIGVLGLTHESNQAIYTSSSDPFAVGDLVCIGPGGDLFEIDAINVGTKTLTLDGLWKNGTSAAVDYSAFRTALHANWKTLQTQITNLTVVCNTTFQFGFKFDKSMNCELSKITILSNGIQGNSRSAINFKDSFKNSLLDIIVDVKTAASTQGWTGITLQGTSGIGNGNLIFKDIQLLGTETNKLGGGDTKVSKYIGYHFKRLTGTDVELIADLGYLVHSTLVVDWLGNCSGDIKLTTLDRCEMYGDRINFKHIHESVGAGILRMRGAKCVVSVSYFGTGEVSFSYGTQFTAFSNDLGNIMTDSYINGTLTIINASMIVSSSVMYNAISGGTLGTNYGFLF